MNNRKQPNRFLAMLLSLCMLMVILPSGAITAFAAEEEIVISSDTEWDTITLSNNVRIESGVTLTIKGCITINGEVTISGGTIVRGDNGAYFSIGSAASLTADGVTVDGGNIPAGYSMFDVSEGELSLKSSTVQNCTLNTSRGSAIRLSQGTLTIEDTNIINCSASGYGGAIYLLDGTNAVIKSGSFSGNRTTSSTYGGGFIYNRQSTLIIEGGSFLDNSSTGKGGVIYNTGLTGTATYIRGGVFWGNSSSYKGFEGSGAIFFSSVNTADTVLYISGSAQFGNGEGSEGDDSIYLDTDSAQDALRKIQLSSALQYPVNIYVACAEGRVIAEGVEGYSLTASDMVQLQFHDTGSTGVVWHAWLDSENNTVYLSATKPSYVLYDANGAAGSVTDNTIYSSGEVVTVKSADGLTRKGYAFTGWNVVQDGTGTTYQPGETFTINETTTLYAQWEAATYQVTLPSGSGYTAAAANGSTSPVTAGGSYSFTLEIADGYQTTADFAVKANGVKLTPDQNGVYTISDITEDQAVTVEGVELNSAPPTVKIELGGNQWDSFPSSAAFRLFFKTPQTVTITAGDTGSGTAVTEYFVSDTFYESADALEKAAEGQWKTYTEPFSIEPNGKNIIYAKATSGTGNVGYASSGEIILYSDAAQQTESILFTKTGTTDVIAAVALNGNTIDEIYCGDVLLISGTDYSVNDGMITFKADWLNTLQAGSHTLTVSYNPLGEEYADGNGNEAPDTTGMMLYVQRMAGSVTGLSDISKVYDGKVVSDITYSALSTGSAAIEYKERGAEDSTYTNTKPSAAGQYTVRVTVAADDNYDEASAAADFEITYLGAPSAPSFGLSGTQGENGWYTSDVTITPPEGYTVSGSLNGEYSGSFTISESTENVSVYFKNEQGQMTDAIPVGGIKIDKDDPFISASGNTDRYLQSDTVRIAVSDATSGVAKVEVKKDDGEFTDITGSYESGYSVAENGTYVFHVTDTAGRVSEATLVYDKIDTQKPVLTISAILGTEAYTSGTWTNQDITLTPENITGNPGDTDYQYRVDGGSWQDYTGPVVISEDTGADGVIYEFKATSASGVEGDVASITVKRDTAVPEGDITIQESSVRRFLNVITFGLFFNENVDVAITGSDGLSGVASIEYYRSAEILQEDEVTSLTSWRSYVAAIHETAIDAEKFIYYVKITDHAGNIALFGSDGATFDLTKPVISGAADGSNCYTTQKVTITDANLDSVTLNGQPVTLQNGTLALPGNTNAAYTITAADLAGNSTTVSVTMNPIADLAEGINGLTTANVTSADEETISSVKTAAGNVNTENATEAEKTALEAIINNCGDLLDKIVEVKQELNDAAGGIGGFDVDSVKSSDKDGIETLIERIDTLLEGGSLTEAEKEELETAKGTAENLLEQITAITGEINDVTEAISRYDADSVKSSNRAAIEKLADRIDALLDGQHLTETERQSLEAAKDTAKTLLNKIRETAGAGGTGNIQNVQDITPDNVRLEDKADLESAKKDIQQALSDYANNYTEGEKKQFREALKQIEDALDIIQHVENMEETVGELPENVSADDTEAEKQIHAAKEQYDALSDYEKSLVTEETIHKLNTLLAQLGDYRIIKGSGSTWTKGSSGGLTFTANGAYSKFMGIEIDSAAISAENYTAESGSTVIMLKPDYLNTLTAEEHAVTVLYTDGNAQGTFTIAEKQANTPGTAGESSAPPETGDDFHIIPWIMLMLISGGAVLTLNARRKGKKDMSKQLERK